MLSVLYGVLIGLGLLELALVGWTVNFLRRYAFRPNPGLVDYRAVHHWSRPLYAPAAQPTNAANQGRDLFERRRGARRR